VESVQLNKKYLFEFLRLILKMFRMTEYLSSDQLIDLFSTSNAKIPMINYLKFLLENKADINKLLVEVVLGRNIEGVKFLLENKADVTTQNNAPLINCSYHCDSDIIKLLVSSKADITARNNEFVIRACSLKRNVDLVKYLIENKADITDQNSEALLKTSYSSSVQMMELLIKNKADIASRKDHCLHIALFHGNYEIVYYLEGKGCCLPEEDRGFYLVYKTVRRRRKIVFRRFIRKVVTPLYYSPGFPGYLKGKKELCQFG